MTEGFLTDIYTVELFFRFCRRYHIEGKEDRLYLVRELARRKKAKYLRDVGPLLAGKKILIVDSNHNAGPEHFCPECKPKGDC